MTLKNIWNFFIQVIHQIFNPYINSYCIFFRVNNAYSEKLTRLRHSEQKLITLAWKVKELSELNEIGRKLFADVTRLVTEIKSNDSVWVETNIPSQLSHIGSSLVSLITRVTRHHRTAATHILVFMISSEKRRKKPCLPYKGLADSTV